ALPRRGLRSPHPAQCVDPRLFRRVHRLSHGRLLRLRPHGRRCHRGAPAGADPLSRRRNDSRGDRACLPAPGADPVRLLWPYRNHDESGVDYFILPEDFVGSAECFSEAVLAVPRAAMPFAQRPVPQAARRPADGTVRVAIPASTMKLNPLLFDALASIVAGARSRVAFQFFPLAATGLPYFELSRIVRAAIPQATVFPEAPHERYMERLAECDLFLCPFPYGNMNSIIDAFQLGLPGVCLDGIEAHAHADAAFFARIALPAELIAGSVDDYVAAAVKLIDDEAWRAHCTDI